MTIRPNTDAPTKDEVLTCLENFTALAREDYMEPVYIRRMTSSDGTSVIEVEMKGPGIEEVDDDEL